MLVRPTARLIAFDPDGRVLLFLCRIGSRDPLFWITPGGGVEPGETFGQAALRELREETGIDARSPIGPCALEAETAGYHPDYGDREILYRDRTFSIHPSASEIARLDPAAVEQAGYIDHRWWSVTEIEAATEPIFPEGFANLVRGILGASW